MAPHKANNMSAHQYVTNDPLHQLFDAVDSVSVQGYDEQRRVIYWNKGSELLYGYSHQEAIGKKLEDLIIPAPMREPVIEAHSNWIKHDIEIPASELTLKHKKGNDVAVFSSHVMFTNQYNTKQMYCIDIDLSEVHKAQAEATFNANMLKTIFEAIPDLFFVLEQDGTITDYHAGNNNDLYIPPQQFIGKKMIDVLPKKVAKKFQIHIEKTIAQDNIVRFEYELSMPEGVIYYEARLRLLPRKNQIMVIIRDISEPHRSAELIRHQAHFDSLTDLPNRFLSLDRLSQILIEVQKNHEKAAVFFLDLDDFKKVNDSLGHEIGDKLLIEAAHRLQQTLKQNDTVGRLGGDEFIVLISSLNDENDALAIAERLLQAFRKPFKLVGRDLILTLSIGIAISPKDGTCSSVLLRNADTAMYQAKAMGRNTSSFFTPQMNVAMRRRFEIEEQMHGALERNEFELYYQPQIDVKTNTIVGAEALLRWHNIVLGEITPDEFIPIAEQTGLIAPIGVFVLQQALRFLNEWQSINKQNYTMAINLSPRQFRDPELVNIIKRTLHKNSISNACLELEITEGVLMNSQTSIRDALLQIDELGIKLSMDDFGTGYSSLSYLREYPFDVLKIDRSFITGITDNKADCNLVKAAIAMSHSLEIKVVAEGVETKEQLDLLNELNCDIAQGFYLSKPLPGAKLLNFSSRYCKAT
ncbi:EAL domain-containing protein [Pseudoalteromonas sp. Scap03]|jgi:diguanylate cyclase (GGDEF)-like protein/PAS domain S-box-containing protein|uniref:bifunctional diguanylate cyclase/phosphodiesterase n=1 Tax=unclassified Pseudoalteromonas TaxID=194690 RepID=UPI0015BE801A|nr:MULTISPECIES: bifunctional diguanylate cyclase/phosphodiesterase [unclassified Pseudoalteromonas]NWL17712.1 EAL domain-containing protein [Pseudoalteromonas sp. Scap03]QLE83091.1 EAL domain-containing protein [Pseudoalteromonas sp. Scap25]QLE91033.1 EAL domain-containing protein [Pseudoalteromonas sp. Scap06]